VSVPSSTRVSSLPSSLSCGACLSLSLFPVTPARPPASYASILSHHPAIAISQPPSERTAGRNASSAIATSTSASLPAMGGFWLTDASKALEKVFALLTPRDVVAESSRAYWWAYVGVLTMTHLHSAPFQAQSLAFLVALLPRTLPLGLGHGIERDEKKRFSFLAPSLIPSHIHISHHHVLLQPSQVRLQSLDLHAAVVRP
jgi:hypothetical protein